MSLPASQSFWNIEMRSSIRIDSDLALSLLLEKSEGAKFGLLNFSRSKVHLEVYTPKTHCKRRIWKQFWEILMISFFLFTPFPHLPVWMLQADSTMGTRLLLVQQHSEHEQNSTGT